MGTSAPPSISPVPYHEGKLCSGDNDCCSVAGDGYLYCDIATCKFSPGG